MQIAQKKYFLFFLQILSFSVFFFFVARANALLSMELTQGISGAIPVTIQSFAGQQTNTPPASDISAVIKNDLTYSGRFVIKASTEASAVLTGSVKRLTSSTDEISYVLQENHPVPEKKIKTHILLKGKFTASEHALRLIAHKISDKIYQTLTGVRGVFSTQIAYVVVQREGSHPHYFLELADADGYNPRQLLSSTEPIMSPVFSPDGRKIAYVSFEKKYAAIYLQTLASGKRILLSEVPGINGAPAFSPDGKKMAIVLSKSGSPNLYLLDLSTHHLRQLTHDWSINTEPAFSPDGKWLVFTSNRGGSPQIYQMKLADGHVSRVTFDGSYNARASFTTDGKSLVMINQTGGLFNIALLDLDTGIFRVLTATSRTDNESPVLAPNGKMVLYGTNAGGRNVLAIASTDGRVQLRLPGRDGDVQDPAWSPWVI